MPNRRKTGAQSGILRVTIKSAKGLRASNDGPDSSTYIKVSVLGSVRESKHLKQDTVVTWDEVFDIPIEPSDLNREALPVELSHFDGTGAQVSVGQTAVNLAEIEQQRHSIDYEITLDDGQETRGTVLIAVDWFSTPDPSAPQVGRQGSFEQQASAADHDRSKGYSAQATGRISPPMMNSPPPESRTDTPEMPVVEHQRSGQKSGRNTPHGHRPAKFVPARLVRALSRKSEHSESDSTIETALSAFQQIDVHHTGFFECRDLRDALVAAGIDPSQPAAAELLHEYDEHSDSKIDEHEFLHLVHELRGHMTRKGSFLGSHHGSFLHSSRSSSQQKDLNSMDRSNHGKDRDSSFTSGRGKGSSRHFLGGSRRQTSSNTLMPPGKYVLPWEEDLELGAEQAKQPRHHPRYERFDNEMLECSCPCKEIGARAAAMPRDAARFLSSIDYLPFARIAFALMGLFVVIAVPCYFFFQDGVFVSEQGTRQLLLIVSAACVGLAISSFVLATRLIHRQSLLTRPQARKVSMH